MTILVTGGTGTLGRPTVQLLRASGHDVRILSRSTGGDLSTGAGLATALEGVDTVLHLATSASTKDVRQAQNLVDAAVAAGMEVVASTEAVMNGEDEVNLTRDYVAQYAKRTGPLIDIWVQATAPAHKAGRVWIKTT